jgi:3'-phosphoadenosine 5'-phosphosulfate (PAPS) 3'-phosphatase
MADPEIDIQTVINRLTSTIAQLTADLAVKDALIEALRAQRPELEVVAVEDQDDA